ncbi:hypothetical protein OsJ_33978 [Oryza sativa Japonica Group]|uniref:Retrovirus-related Pol polyprotein from transposon TNT 1-94-like beta-barrel domain-containing protein n=1 Tax=Oryza sativa subsp. japonica TaxID=39947 RepID=A3CBI8_ORYSJ|nr:hypothetical protein OsJ_33978 [Oryza sativa Japonica Group]
MSATATAYSVWRDLAHQFLGNQERRAINLNVEFRTFAQGDPSISDYCRLLKSMADMLGDLGEPVHDRSLVLQHLTGLSPKFGHMQSLLSMQKPFPSFLDARSQLLLEEITKGSKSVEPATAFIVSKSGSVQPASGKTCNTSQGSSNNSRNRRRGRGKRERQRWFRREQWRGPAQNPNQSAPPRPAASSTQASAQRPAQWPSPYNPWAGTNQMWPGQVASGLLGPRPAFAGTALGPVAYQAAQGTVGPVSSFGHSTPPASVYATPPSVVPPSPHMVPQPQPWSAPSQWDPQVLASNYNTAALTPPTNDEWYVDSGASSHMTPHTGTLTLAPTTSPSYIVVGNGSLLPITATGSACINFPHQSFLLNNVLVSPDIIRNLISARRFVCDNW